MLVSYLNYPMFYVNTSLSSRVSLFCFLCVFAPGKARLEELKEKLVSPSLKGSAKQMSPIDFEKVGQVCSEISAAHTAEATDKLAAEC